MVLLVWRTSTPEPTRGDGIIWTYIKDVTRYTPLFAKNGTFIFQLDNVIQEGLDGVYSSKQPAASLSQNTRLTSLQPSCMPHTMRLPKGTHPPRLQI